MPKDTRTSWDPRHAQATVQARTRESTDRIEYELGDPTPAQLERFDRDPKTEAAPLISSRYRLVRRLAEGTMSRVYLGNDLTSGATVAIKILRARETNDAAGITRFLREAKVGAQIDDPNVVHIHCVGSTTTGMLYLVMEMLPGEDLGQTLDRCGWLRWPLARAMMLQICAGLAAAHARGVIHRDLKPANCFRVIDGQHEQIKLLDFGVSKLIEPGAHESDEGQMIVGTPTYMSPEQARGDAATTRSDIYAAGVLLYRMLTGRVPFGGESPAAVMTKHILERPPPVELFAPEGVVIGPRVAAVIARALAKDPADRFASIEGMAAALRAIPATEPAPEHAGARSSRVSPSGSHSSLWWRRCTLTVGLTLALALAGAAACGLGQSLANARSDAAQDSPSFFTRR